MLTIQMILAMPLEGAWATTCEAPCELLEEKAMPRLTPGRILRDSREASVTLLGSHMGESWAGLGGSAGVNTSAKRKQPGEHRRKRK